MNEVDKVKTILSKGVRAFGSADAVKVWSDEQTMLVLLKNGRWMATHRGEDVSDLDGCVGGYNRHVDHVMTGLLKVSAISRSQFNAFMDWYERQEEIHRGEQDLIRAQEYAGRVGMKLVPMENGK